MPRLVSKSAPSGHKVLVVDDAEEVVESTRLLLEKDGHTVETASNGPAAIDRCKDWKPHLLIVDYFMPGMTGEEVVNAVRPLDNEMQILLQTGYASEKPPRDMLRRLDIQGYHDKSEGPEKLLIWVDAALKAYRQISTISKNRSGLRHILDAVPEMYNLQTLEELLRGILIQMDGLFGGDSSFVAAVPEALGRNEDEKEALAVAVGEEDNLEIVAGTGRFSDLNSMDGIDRELLKVLKEYLLHDGINEVGTKTFVPLRVGRKPLGVLYFDRKSGLAYDTELVRMFAMQASQALENRRLFGMATEDDLTKVFLRNFFFRRLLAEVQEACRYEYPIALCMIDVDKFKHINDSQGHLVGDKVLREVSACIRNSVRGHDFVGRYGGDEFEVSLPHTESKTAVEVIERLRARIEALEIAGLDPSIKATISCGVATLEGYQLDGKRAMLSRETWQKVVERLFASADRALYMSKEKGRNCVSAQPPVTLSALVEELEEVAHS